MDDFTFVDLFAGIGGMRKAFEKAGGKCIFSSEWDKYCQKTYKANFGEIPFGDIRKQSIKDKIKKHDLLLAGFPCQPFSSIGKREGFRHITQGTLFYDIAKIINDKRPDAFLLENVPGLKTHDNGRTFKVITDILNNELKYKIFFDILDAADYGLPQERKRLFIVGFNKEKVKNKDIVFNFPKKNKNKVFINKYLENNVKGYSISRHLQKSYLFKVKDGRPQVIDKTSKIQVKTLVASYHKIQRLTGTFVRDGETGLRLLTENECKAIMGFPNTFKRPSSVSRTQMYRQFGNSIALPLVEKIAKKMVKVVEKIKNDYAY